MRPTRNPLLKFDHETIRAILEKKLDPECCFRGGDSVSTSFGTLVEHVTDEVNHMLETRAAIDGLEQARVRATEEYQQRIGDIETKIKAQQENCKHDAAKLRTGFGDMDNYKECPICGARL